MKNFYFRIILKKLLMKPVYFHYALLKCNLEKNYFFIDLDARTAFAMPPLVQFPVLCSVLHYRKWVQYLYVERSGGCRYKIMDTFPIVQYAA